MQILRAADKAHRGHAEAMVIQRGFRRSNQTRVIGQPEIIIRTQIQKIRITLCFNYRNMPSLGRGQGPFQFSQPRRVNIGKARTRRFDQSL